MVRRDSCESEIDPSSLSCNSEEAYDGETASIASTTSNEITDKQLVIEDSFGKYNPTFGKVSVANCNDIHFGNKTFYNGPVTIKQFLCTANDKLTNSDSGISDHEDTEKVSDVPNALTKIDANLSDAEEIKCIKTKITTAPTDRVHNKKGWFRGLPRTHLIFVVSLSVVLVISLVISSAVLLLKSSISIGKGITAAPYPEDGRELDVTDVGIPKENGSFTLPGKLRIVGRTEWLAQPPTEQPSPLQVPVPYVVLMHTATETCTDLPTCIFHVRHIQMYHIESRKWWDIGYNFLVGGDGFAYEGRGWKLQGAHTYGYNARSIGIALIGTFTNVMPLPRQINATKQLIQKGLELGYIAKDYKILGAYQLQSTDSPGKLFQSELKTWDHWAETP